MRQRPGSNHLFHVKHELLTVNRLENRLLKTTLELVHQHCHNPQHWRISNILMHRLESIPTEPSAAQQLKRWSTARLMQHYAGIKPWCELILKQMNPNFQKGTQRGIALLFQMERLFESHVRVSIDRIIDTPWKLVSQSSTHHLITNHCGKPIFALKPDLILQVENTRQVLDTKWKLLDENCLLYTSDAADE